MTGLNRQTFPVELEITFRLAKRTDLPKLEWYGQYAHFRTVFRRTFSEQEHRRRLMLVADCADFPIGHVFIQLNSGERGLSDGRARAYLYSLRVMEMFRGKGIGTRLIEEAESIVRELGFGWTTIAAAKENPRARRLYEKMGYRVFMEDDGEWSYIDHEGRMRNVHEPCWVLEKRLGIR
ncbi:MAG: GNAT family N-acetyltransferase [Anaerolinea sp.]|nr:GNAT family N-acetyltransferase [Anaerolinea sp.]